MPVSDVGRYAPTAPATSSRFAPLELRDGRFGDALTLALARVSGVSLPVVDVEDDATPPVVLWLGSVVLPAPNAVEPNVLPATANVDAIGVKWPKLPVAVLSAPVSEKKWIVPVSLDAHRIVELSLNARQ